MSTPIRTRSKGPIIESPSPLHESIHDIRERAKASGDFDQYFSLRGSEFKENTRVREYSKQEKDAQWRKLVKEAEQMQRSIQSRKELEASKKSREKQRRIRTQENDAELRKWLKEARLIQGRKVLNASGKINLALVSSSSAGRDLIGSSNSTVALNNGKSKKKKGKNRK